MFLVFTTAGQVLSVPFTNELGSIRRTLRHSDYNGLRILCQNPHLWRQMHSYLSRGVVLLYFLRVQDQIREGYPSRNRY